MPMKKAIVQPKHPETERDDFLGKNPMRRTEWKEQQPPKRKREKDMGDNL